MFREFPFPVDPGRSHVPEIVASSLAATEVVWRAMSRRYETRYVNEILRVYYRGADDQMTRLSPRTWARIRSWYAQRLYEDREWLTVAPLVLLKLAIHYARFSFLSGDPVRAQIAPLASGPLKLLWATASPVGLVLSLRDRARESAAARSGSRLARPPHAHSQ